MKIAASKDNMEALLWMNDNVSSEYRGTITIDLLKSAMNNSNISMKKQQKVNLNHTNNFWNMNIQILLKQ
ncbi:hypothetical protein PPL_11653 [Heterostelium album PN500]|uniref:Uncharacterized protein n=1 Tax=Heterostelium pallidum (strain ATCC 26659 / Pp 5 / PN500) TaxID=670386 RepID=D3BVC7_HETP5|nr:hypothetical protein PPL_11653 [Heterostelium album PN500]EFA74684.1 hypothetical protein PPL_11653 [Heterostelium album PN500]|eukprot:XP_020426818.1 hypothetical protein PPL_11653 [Heterostelium album PN500]